MDNEEKNIPSMDELSAQVDDGLGDFDIFAETPKEESNDVSKDESNIQESKTEVSENEPAVELNNKNIKDDTKEAITPNDEVKEDVKEENNSKKSFDSPVVLDDEEEVPQGENGMITVRPVKFQQFEPTEPIRAIKKNLDIMQDVSMHITVELGRSISTIKDVMDMVPGSVVELNKVAGEQVEIYANGKIIAKGEVIVIEDKFGVRVTSTNIIKEED